VGERADDDATQVLCHPAMQLFSLPKSSLPSQLPPSRTLLILGSHPHACLGSLRCVSFLFRLRYIESPGICGGN
jgi:hypothetical protein